jgi:hypothetical protein
MFAFPTPSQHKGLLFFRRKVVFWSLITYGLWLLALISVTSVSAFFLTRAARHRDFAGISKYSSQLQVTLNLLNFSTFTVIPDIGFLHQVASLPASNYPFLFWFEQVVADPFLPTESPLSPKIVTELTDQLTAINQQCGKTWLIKWLTADHFCQKMDTIVTFEQDIAPFMIKHLEQDHTYIILFQNSEELRASGGFMGSFAKVVVGAQGLSYLEIQDIYEPDGQFKGFISAPPGVAEYLSSGHGLRLPDANWEADFPTAAQTVLSYFSFGNHQSVDGVIAINSTLIEKMLQVTGDIYLPDYNTNVSAETFSTLARANREEFFPGSKQKQHFLSSFMTQFKLRLTQLSPSQQATLAELLNTSLKTKDILAYSTDPGLQALLEQHRVAGSLANLDNKNFFYLVESNVGINKANKHVSRRVDLTFNPNASSLTIAITNDNQESGFDYANYQRLIIPRHWQVTQVLINNQPVSKWDESILTPSADTSLKQIGFLVGVPIKQSVTITLNLASPLTTSSTDSYELILVKQPGLPATPYQVRWQDQTTDLLLDQDLELPLPL